ncbi:MAG TPA: hypothetical protein VK824_04645, partial [Planctomycetota bacterium]|nr:hypothetical protein [Planctomycetota bacterium]
MAAPAPADLLARIPPAARRTLTPGPRASSASPAVAAAFLARLEATDRAILVLALGLGLDLGTVAFALQLDPSIVAWRLRRTLISGSDGGGPAALEAGVTQWLRSPAEGVPARGEAEARRAGKAAGAGRAVREPAALAESHAGRAFAELPDVVRERIATRLDRHEEEAATNERRPGLGIGSLVLILVAAAGFMVYGALRDVNPLWRGKAQVRAAEYAAARDSFQELGSLPEGRAWIAMTWLAEGDYEHALAVLAEPETAKFLGEFRPMDAPLEPVDADPASQALLPRGLVADPRPRFVYVADGTSALTLEVHPEQPNVGRKVRWPLPAAGAATGVTVLEYPKDWPSLTEGVVLWDVQDGSVEPTAFSVLEKDVRRDLVQHAAAFLTHEIPLSAREFLRAQFDLRNGLLEQAAGRFAMLAKEIPTAAYPRLMLARIG